MRACYYVNIGMHGINAGTVVIRKINWWVSGLHSTIYIKNVPRIAFRI